MQTSPSGIIYPAHFIPGQKGVYNRPDSYKRCIVIGTDKVNNWGGTIEPGNWVVTFKYIGTKIARDIGLHIWVDMVWDSWQQGVCPEEDWILGAIGN